MWHFGTSRGVPHFFLSLSLYPVDRAASSFFFFCCCCCCYSPWLDSENRELAHISRNQYKTQFRMHGERERGRKNALGGKECPGQGREVETEIHVWLENNNVDSVGTKFRFRRFTLRVQDNKKLQRGHLNHRLMEHNCLRTQAQLLKPWEETTCCRYVSVYLV